MTAADRVHVQAPLFTEPIDVRPGRVRYADPPTSRSGARSVAYRAGSQKARLMAVYVDAYPAGLTDEEAAKLAGLFAMRTACWWKRSNELRQDERIVPTGEERNGEAGTPRMVCRASVEVMR